jgi:uncharacterized membrane protein (UPF0127 family)
MRVVVAGGFRARARGLALRRDSPPYALLIPRCRSVHTFGMQFALDLVFLDSRGRVLRVDRAVPRNRVRRCRGAHAVLEVPVNIIPPMAEGKQKLRAALDPRVPIYRDTYNEYFVFLLSAGGAAAGTQVPLYIVMAIMGELWSVGVFVGACVVFELVVIFGLARPQMKANERVGWALLWGATTAALAFCFWHLVASPTL